VVITAWRIIFFVQLQLQVYFAILIRRLENIEIIFCREAKNLPFIQYVICLAVIEVRYGESEQDNFMLMT